MIFVLLPFYRNASLYVHGGWPAHCAMLGMTVWTKKQRMSNTSNIVHSWTLLDVS